MYGAMATSHLCRLTIIFSLFCFCLCNIETYVSPTGSDGSGNGTYSNPYHTVGRAVEAAKTYPQDLLMLFLLEGNYPAQGNSYLQVTQDIVINCAIDKVFIDLQGADYFMTVTSESFSMSGCRISNSSKSAIVISASRVSLHSCYFEDNGKGGSHKVQGGALSVTIPSLASTPSISILESIFIRNSAGNGGAVYLLDNSMKARMGIISNVFEDNYAWMNGSAIYSSCCFGELTSSYSRNHAVEFGGAVYIQPLSSQPTGTLSIGNTVAENNTAGESGGAMAVYKCNLLSSFSILLSGNRADQSGGGLFLEQSNLTAISNQSLLLLVNNSAEMKGGAVFISQGHVSLARSSIQDNTALLGGFFYLTQNSTLVDSKPSFAQNFVVADPALLFVAEGCGIHFQMNSYPGSSDIPLPSITLQEGGWSMFYMTSKNGTFGEVSSFILPDMELGTNAQIMVRGDLRLEGPSVWFANGTIVATQESDELYQLAVVGQMTLNASQPSSSGELSSPPSLVHSTTMPITIGPNCIFAIDDDQTLHVQGGSVVAEFSALLVMGKGSTIECNDFTAYSAMTIQPGSKIHVAEEVLMAPLSELTLQLTESNISILEISSSSVFLGGGLKVQSELDLNTINRPVTLIDYSASMLDSGEECKFASAVFYQPDGTVMEEAIFTYSATELTVTSRVADRSVWLEWKTIGIYILVVLIIIGVLTIVLLRRQNVKNTDESEGVSSLSITFSFLISLPSLLLVVLSSLLFMLSRSHFISWCVFQFFFFKYRFSFFLFFF